MAEKTLEDHYLTALSESDDGVCAACRCGWWFIGPRAEWRVAGTDHLADQGGRHAVAAMVETLHGSAVVACTCGWLEMVAMVDLPAVWDEHREGVL